MAIGYLKGFAPDYYAYTSHYLKLTPWCSPWYVPTGARGLGVQRVAAGRVPGARADHLGAERAPEQLGWREPRLHDGV